MKREQVYEAIDSERDYQDSRWGHLSSSNEEGNGERSVDEFILYIQQYTHLAAKFATEGAGTKEKTDIVRKIAGLAVACLEQHGVERREGF